MKVVFLQDVTNVASAGDVKKVADGYARNYLFPKQLAVLATPAEMQKLESRHKADARRQSTEEQEAQALAQVLEELTVGIKVRAGTKDRIYGSVTSAAIAKEMKRLTGRDIDKHTIEIEEPIKVLGSHKVSVRLTRNVAATVSIMVEAKEVKEEAAKEPKEEAVQEVEQAEEVVQEEQAEEVKPEEETAEEALPEEQAEEVKPEEEEAEQGGEEPGQDEDKD
ncbi:50S ribosomal protein L9 [Chloroflexota bacterium]